MSSNKSVCVLLPNKRRQTVKINLDSTIWQVLEEVCRKHNYNPDEYDLKHYNKVVDVNAIFRYSGLPNNVLLEMEPCTKVRKISDISLVIQLENGDRKMGEIPSNASLKEALKKICPEEDESRVTLIYFHRKIHGKEELEKTTLRSLGLDTGKAMLRLLNRSPEELKQQAHVYTPPTPKEPIRHDSEKDKQLEKKIVEPATILNPVEIPLEQKSSQENSKSDESLHENVEQVETVEPMDIGDENEQKEEKCEQKVEEEVKIEYLGERNALVFNKNDVKAKEREETSDDFFQVTVNDAKMMLRDAVKKRKELEDMPLVTAAQRQLEIEKEVLSRLNKYTVTVIRVQFPDQLVLQGLFHPLEFVQTVKNHVKAYLESPDCDFSLYMTPPKRELDPQKRLVDEHLVPSAILHFSGATSLREDVRSKLTDPEIVDADAVKHRLGRNREALQSTRLNMVKGNETTSETRKQEPGTSQTKTPKWFKNFQQTKK